MGRVQPSRFLPRKEDIAPRRGVRPQGKESDLMVRRKESNVKVRTPGKIGLLKAMMFDSEDDRCLVGGG